MVKTLSDLAVWLLQPNVIAALLCDSENTHHTIIWGRTDAATCVCSISTPTPMSRPSGFGIGAVAIVRQELKINENGKLWTLCIQHTWINVQLFAINQWLCFSGREKGVQKWMQIIMTSGEVRGIEGQVLLW